MLRLIDIKRRIIFKVYEIYKIINQITHMSYLYRKVSCVIGIHEYKAKEDFYLKTIKSQYLNQSLFCKHLQVNNVVTILYIIKI